LSKTTTSSSRARSSANRSRTRKPLRAARVVEMEITRGMASPSAWGQAMTSTATTRRMTKPPGAPSATQTASVSRAAPMAMKVSQKAARSARA
jgi:hypothetical protein